MHPVLWQRWRLVVVALLTAGRGLLLCDSQPRPARAATLVVTTTVDSGPDSLREAILTANASPGLDIITFAIPATGAQTIQPLSALPTVTDPVVIDGTTQPGYSDRPQST